MESLLRILILCAALLLSPAVKATAQASDVLIVDGQEFALNTNPLEAQLEQKKWRPPDDAAIWSSNWRGYIATWEVKGDKFFLRNVSIAIADPKDANKEIRKNIIGDLYPGASEVFADWYTGALIVPDGKMIRYVHMGYGSSYDHYQIFRVRAGQIVEHLSLDAAEFEAYKQRKFDEFSKTDQFKSVYADVRKNVDGLDEQQTIDFIKAYFAEQYLSH